jgi:phage major head subunit gpT-like protein
MDYTVEVASVINVLKTDSYTVQHSFVLDCSRTIKPVIFQNRK